MSAVFGLYCDVGDAMAPSALSPTQTNLDELPSPSETAPSVPPQRTSATGRTTTT